MHTPQRPHSRIQRWLAAALTWTLIAGQVTLPVYAQTVPPALADVPIAAKVAAKPNIVYTVDDSGSMSSSYIPDWVVSIYCRSGSGVTTCPVANNTGNTFIDAPFWAADFNHLAYNPNVTYQPPIKADGTPLTSNVGVVTDAFGNQNALGTLTNIQSDPYLFPLTLVNLSVGVAVRIYCNSDWPLDVTIPVNGEWSAGNGKGADCRINGTRYDAAANGAPAVIDDYNYPWQNTVSPNNAQYFFRTGFTKQLWCNPAAANYPTKTCGRYCPAGVPTTTNVPQTWSNTGNVNTCCTGAGAPVAGCPSASTYSPASCNTSTIYCAPGLGKAGECTGGCSCNTRVTGQNGNCTYTDPITLLPVVSGTLACSGAGCTASCPNINVTTGCTIGSPSTQCASAGFCNAYLNGSATTTLLDDANLVNGGTGAVCRHNNQAYGATPAGPVTYSTAALGGLAPWNTAVTGTAAAAQNLVWGFRAGQACPSGPTNVTIPRHYYTIDSVSYCNGTIGVNNAQWKGFGTGVCQSKNDLTTYKNIQYGTSASGGPAGFHRIDLVNDLRTFAYKDPVTGAAKTRNYAQEVVNYSNWYAYYRTRILAAKTTSAIAFSFLDNTYRVGFQNLGSELAPDGLGSAAGATIKWVNVGDFQGTTAGTTRFDWYSTLFGIAITTYTTPLMNGMYRVGNLFQKGTSAGVPAGVTPLPNVPAVTDPITLSCQNNYHILFTDGFTNQAKLPVKVGNADGIVPAWIEMPDIAPDNVLPNLRPKTGLAWPTPFLETAPAMSETLADIATYYWATDLRDSTAAVPLKNNVPANSGKGTGDIDYTKDVAWWQHVNFNAISFGSDGVLDAANQIPTLAAITAGTQSWTRTTPNPNQPTNPAGNPGAAAVDDLWHATVNARGKFVYAKSPLEVAYGLAGILAGIQNQRKSRIGAAFSGQVLDATNNTIYEATIEPGWAGDLLKVLINPKTGAEISTPWQAATQLAAQIKPASSGDEPWFTKRKVVTNNAVGVGVPFLYSKLSAAQLKSLSSDPTQQQAMIAYLRGGTTFGSAPVVTIEGTNIGQFRQRAGSMGDITNAQPVIVNAPSRPYLDATDPFYSTFKAAQSARPTRIYAAANDGMLHSFDGATGNEDFAYIPGSLMRGDATSTATQDVTGLQALTYQDGGVPIFHHRFYVDSSPRSADVDFGNGTGDWHSILVGGLGKGGNTYYALDITDVSPTTEAVAATKVLWEWRNPDNDDDTANLDKLVSTPGYTYGRPVVVKTRAYGWTVLVTSGYNNKTGLGKLFFLDAKTGALLKTMSTGAGTSGNPSGFAQIHAFVKDFRNQVAEQVYGGDLLGNLWRFDVSDANPLNWTVVQFAKLTDPGGTVQPITTAPQIEVDLNNGIDRFVFIGTGRLLDTSDLTNPATPQVQTMYAIRDGKLASMLTSGLPIIPRKPIGIMDPINPDGISAIVGGAPNGWYHDLPSTAPTAERIVVDVQADINVTAYIGTQAQTDPCELTLPASLYARDFTTGKSLLDNGSGVVASIPASEGAVGGLLVGRTDPVTGAQTLGWLISKEKPGSQPFDIVNPVTGPGNRLSWRLLTGQ